MKKRFFVMLMVSFFFTISIFGSKLVINSYNGDPEPKRVMNLLVENFKDLHPDIEVELNIFAMEDYKTLLRTWLPSQDAPDVVQWFSGERMRYFAQKDLLLPIDDILGDSFDDYFPAAFKTACTYDSKLYFVPESWYWWGVYYKKSMFEKLGLSTPKTWEEFINICGKIQAAGITPITIGTKYLWTTGAWFDYLNMRVNGLEWYTEFLDGGIAYNDAKVKKAMSYWQELVDNEYFNDDHSSLSWQEALTRMINDEAAMYLMGQFIKDSTPEEMRDDLEFFSFPVIDSSIPVYQETPIDGWMVPKNARNREDAKLWMEFVAGNVYQGIVSKELGRLAANKNVPVPNEDAEKGLEMIMESKGVMGFYDRDTDPEMANRGMNGFVQFMMYPENLDNILNELEKERQRIYQ